MDDSKQQWMEWLGGVPPEHQEALFEVLIDKFDMKPSVNADRKVRIVKTPLEDLFVTTPPPYLDIFKLHELYKSVAFNTNIIVKGPKGDGKSLSIATYAYETKSPLIIQECSEDTKKMDLMGTQNLLGDETIFTLGSIPAAIETANEYGRCILCFEELNALTNQVQKQLNAVTDFRKQASLPFLGKTYRLREGAYLWVVGLMNPSAYSGTYDLNEDLKSRFEEVDLPYPEVGAEKRVLQAACRQFIGQKMPTSYTTTIGGQSVEIQHVDDTVLNMLLKLAGETRQQATSYALSTRDLVRIIENFSRLGPQAALQLVLCKFEGEEDKNTMKKRIGSIFGPSVPVGTYWGVSPKGGLVP